MDFSGEKKRGGGGGEGEEKKNGQTDRDRLCLQPNQPKGPLCCPKLPQLGAGSLPKELARCFGSFGGFGVGFPSGAKLNPNTAR